MRIEPKVTVTVVGMMRRHYGRVGKDYKRRVLDQAQELFGYHRKAAIRALKAPTVEPGPRILTGRPVEYEPGQLLRWLRPIWRRLITVRGSIGGDDAGVGAGFRSV